MPPTELQNPRQNRILAALRLEEFARLQPALEAVELTLGQVLYEPGGSLNNVYFPTTSLLSLVSTTELGLSVGLTMTGNEGLAGISAVLGSDISPYRVVVQSAGTAYRLHAERLHWELNRSGSLQRLSLAYAQTLMMQIAQTAVCNRHHTVDQQLCRWLLMSLDKLPNGDINMTQATIATLLGVRREAVTEAAGKLQNAGLIRYRRGKITVLDRIGLEACSCECYRAMKTGNDQSFPSFTNSSMLDTSRPLPASLRTQALQRLAGNPKTIPEQQPDLLRLTHELQIHQIELEIQNEQLMEAYDEADALRLRYADIYDFSPLACISVDAQGVIRQINLAGAILLGIRRSQASLHRFGNSLISDDQPLFQRLLKEVLTGGTGKQCRVRLVPADHRGQVTVRIDAVSDENGRECRMVISDVTISPMA